MSSKHREYFSMITIQKALETTQDSSLITFITANQTLVTEGRCVFSLTVWVIPCLFIRCALQMNLTPTALQCGPKMPQNNSCGGDCIVCVCACVYQSSAGTPALFAGSCPPMGRGGVGVGGGKETKVPNRLEMR